MLDGTDALLAATQRRRIPDRSGRSRQTHVSQPAWRGRSSPCRSAIRGAASPSRCTAATKAGTDLDRNERALLGALAHHAEIAYAQVESEILRDRIATLEDRLARVSAA